MNSWGIIAYDRISQISLTLHRFCMCSASKKLYKYFYIEYLCEKKKRFQVLVTLKYMFIMYFLTIREVCFILSSKSRVLYYIYFSFCVRDRRTHLSFSILLLPLLLLLLPLLHMFFIPFFIISGSFLFIFSVLFSFISSSSFFLFFFLCSLSASRVAAHEGINRARQARMRISPAGTDF